MVLDLQYGRIKTQDVYFKNDLGKSFKNHNYQDVAYSPVKQTNMSGTSLIQKLKVITWKNLIIRKRHWLLSIFEIGIPVVLFMLVSYARLKIDGMGNRYVNESTYNPERSSHEFYNNMIDHEVKLFYTPPTDFTSSIIREVQLKLSLNSASIRDFPNEKELIAYYQRFAFNETVMGIVFNGIKGEEVPKHLDYTIRPYEEYVRWQTDGLYTNALQYIPENGSPNYIHKGFIAIQLAIDTSFIEMKAKKFPFILLLQEFPYPPHLDDIGVSDIFLYVLPIVTVFSFVFLSPAIIKRIVEEKNTGIKELMKMMGLKSWMLWLGWFLHAFIVNILSVVVITFLLKVPLWGAQFSAIHHCNWSVFAIFLILYCAAGITYCFAISSLFNRPTLAVVVGSLSWMLTQTIPSGIVETSPNMGWWKKILFALFPNMALTYGYQAISVYESREVGATWSNLFKSASGGEEDVTLGNVFIMFLIDMVVYMLIALYFENVRPGPYGLSKPFHFPVTFLFKEIKKRTSAQIECNSESNSEDYCKIEPAANLKVGIQVQQLCKKFGTQLAVNCFSIDIYEGQITALLGHNGAGKTTTMSIITGMIGASSGRVLINGEDINHNMNKIHGTLGLCPQHNLQFTDLSVIEHLIFFGMLKGLTHKRAIEESEKLLARLNLKSKKKSLASKLSGGMRRKLSLGISLIGNSKVLILDEPTSGLDPEARREIWDILLSLRGSRTIIITTHYMEEADVLGDRIAIMDHGRLICYGTSMYLKNEYGTGYHLTLIRDEAAFKGGKQGDLNQVDEITKIIKSKIGSAVLQSATGYHMTYLLPHDMKPYFGELLLELERQKGNLCITNINVSVTTLEEVFLKVGNMVQQQDQLENSTDNRPVLVARDSVSVNSRQKLIGKNRYFQQLKTLFTKRWLTTKIKLPVFVTQFFIALILTILTIYLGDTSNYTATDTFKEFNMELRKYGETSVFYGAASSNEDITKMQKYYAQQVKAQRGHAISSDSVSNDIIDKGIENIAYYRQHMVVSAEFNASSDGQTLLNAMYSNTALHGAPISVNLLTNAIMKALVGEDYGISISNSPLPVAANSFAKEASEMQIAMLWFILFPLGLLFYTGTFLLFPQMERASNVKQLQFMCGVRSYSYWFTCYIFDLILYWILVITIIIVILVYGLFGSPVFTGGNELCALFLILLVYGFCTIPYSYLYSYKKTPTGAFSLYLMVSLFASIVLSIVILLLEFSGSEYYEKVGRDLKYVFLWFPQLGLAYSSLQFSRKAVSNYNWIIEPTESRNAICRYSPNPCCGSLSSSECKAYQSYFMGDSNLSINLGIMMASTFLYFGILFLLETTIVHELFENCKLFISRTWSNFKSRNSNKGFDVTDSTEVLGYSYDGSKDKDNLLNVKNLQKTYWNQDVVKGISFGVKPGDCFGLLGVNGAGKTTTFRMLTGDELPTHGDATIEDVSGNSITISKDANKYLEKVGYCPQFDAINEVLSGRQMLNTFAELRGVAEDAVEEEVNTWISLLGLQEYADRPCGKYSGGNKRKLSVAIALIGNPVLVMLDEPTSGVDPVSRRKLWNVLTMIQQQDVKPSIVLTSHSMEECEALCNKLTIMKAGRLECFGTIPELKQKYGQGFTIKLKLKIPTLSVVVETMSDETHSNASQTQPLSSTITRASLSLNRANPTDMSDDSNEVRQLVGDFEHQYSGFSKLCDKHSGLLHYHISDKNKKWSELFKEIEALSQKHQIIEDYHISETTLEEVFLSIARS